VNLGSLGFLTAITVDELYPQLEHTLRGEMQLAPRRMLRGELWRGGKKIAEHEALNDLVLTKQEIARMIELEVHSGDHFVCVYHADLPAHAHQSPCNRAGRHGDPGHQSQR